MIIKKDTERLTVSIQLISLASRENSLKMGYYRIDRVSIQLISLASREKYYRETYGKPQKVSIQLISLASREIYNAYCKNNAHFKFPFN